MAATEDDSVFIQLDEDVEGDRRYSSDYYFVGVGEPVPVAAPGDDPEFDLENPPYLPLAVSEQFGLLFVAHSKGFCVAKTKEVVQVAKKVGDSMKNKETEEKRSCFSIKQSCIVDVPIGKVNILALSADSSTLAASVAGDIRFFSVSSLLNKGQIPSFSSSIADQSCVKDLRWTKRMESQYVALSDHGKLYYGAAQDPLKYVMDNVDAVEWSVKGNFVAVATNNILSILSSKFKKKFSMSLSFKSWLGDSDFDGSIKVDSIRWIRPDCIILGYFQYHADGAEESYLIQVVTSKQGKITDASSKLTVLSFTDVFQGLVDDIVPFGCGPYLSLGYVDKCELAIAAHRKNTDQHVVLLGWPQDNEKQAAVIDIARDTLCPKIPLQENDDDNVVLGLCLDKVSYNEKVEVNLEGDHKELSPFCLLLCLSLDGKLFMFQVASATAVSALSEDATLHSENEDDSLLAVSSADDLSDFSSGSPTKSIKQDDQVNQSPKLNEEELFISKDEICLNETVAEDSSKHINSRTLVTDDKPKFSGIKQIQDTAGQQSVFLGKQGTDLGHSSASLMKGTGSTVGLFSNADTEEHLGGFSSKSLSPKPSIDFLSQSTGRISSKEAESGKELPAKLGSAIHMGASSSSLADRKSSPITSDGRSSFLSSSYTQSNSSIKSMSNANMPVGTYGGFSGAKIMGGTSTAFGSSGKQAYGGRQPTPFGPETPEPMPSNLSSPMPSVQNFALGKSSKDMRPVDKENCRTTAAGRLLNSEPHLSKQFGNVEQLRKELESLLERIEEPGGFRDACTVLLQSSILDLEEVMGTLFSRCRQLKDYYTIIAHASYP